MSKVDILRKVLQGIADFSLERVVECCGVEIKPDILQITLYGPDRNIDKFFEVLVEQLDLLKPKSRRHIIIADDFNINKFQNSTNYQRLINTTHFQQMIDGPTGVMNSTSSSIYFIFFNYKNFNVFVEDQGLSDHKSLLYNFKLNVPPVDNILSQKKFYYK